MKRHILISLTTNSSVARIGENLGIRYIKAYLEKNGYNIDILENQFQKLSSEELKKIISQYDVIGFSINYCGQIPVLKEVLNLIEKKHKTIYVGGHFASICYKELIQQFAKIDFVMLSDGELATLELVKNNYCYFSTENVVYKKGNTIIRNHIKIPENLDSLPFPYRNKDSYYMGDKHFAVISSRGCYNRCSYCSVGSFTHCYFNNKIRMRSANNIFAELKLLNEKYNVKYITFQDDLFIGTDKESRSRASKLAQLIISNNLSMFFSIQCSVKSIDIETFSLLFKAGLRNVMIGIENFSPHALKCFRKNQNIDDIQKAIDTLRQIGIPLSYGFIMYYPEMNHSEIIENIKILYKLRILNLRSITSVLQIYIGTEYANRSLENIEITKTDFFITYKFKDNRINQYIEKCRYISKKYGAIETQLFHLEFLSHTDKRIHNNRIELFFSQFQDLVYEYCSDLYNNTFLEQPKNSNMCIENEFVTLKCKIKKYMCETIKDCQDSV